jgi:hypothetical protein
MLHHVATVLVAFQRFPITPGHSMRHERDMEHELDFPGAPLTL